VEIEDEDKFAFLKNDQLILFVHKRDELMTVSHHVELSLHSVHDLVEVAHVAEVELFVVLEAPLSSAPVVAEVIAFTWEVNPFWMGILVAHEVQVGLATQVEGDQSHHFMKSLSPRNNDRVVVSSVVVDF